MERGVKYYLAQQVPFTLYRHRCVISGRPISTAILTQIRETVAAVCRIRDGSEQKELTDKLNMTLGGNISDLFLVLDATPKNSGDGKSATKFQLAFRRHGPALKKVLGDTAFIQVEIFDLLFRDNSGERERLQGFTTQEMPASQASVDGERLEGFVDSTYNAGIDGLLRVGIGVNGFFDGKLNLILIDKSQWECCSVSGMNKRMLEEEIAPDAVIVASNRAEVKCHRGILATRSDVFRTMFGTEMQEAKTRKIEMPDMSEEGVRTFLAYLYHWDTSKAEESCSVALELLMAGHKYNIECLEKVMRKVMLAKPDSWYDVDVAKELFRFVRNLDVGWNLLKKKAVMVLKMRASGSETLGAVQKLFQGDPHAAMDFYNWK